MTTIYYINEKNLRFPDLRQNEPPYCETLYGLKPEITHYPLPKFRKIYLYNFY